MKIKAKRVENGFFIPILRGLENLEEIEVEIVLTDAGNFKDLPEDFIIKHWKDFVFTEIDSSEYYKSESYYENRYIIGEV